MATKKAKPDGQYHLVPDQVASFMKDVKVADLPGIINIVNLENWATFCLYQTGID